MGLRIQKAMGWGLEGTNEEVFDLLQDDWDDLNSKDLHSYKRFLQKKYEVTDEMLNNRSDYTEKFLSAALNSNLVQVSRQLRKKSENCNGFKFITYCDELDEALTRQAFIVTPFSTISEWKRSDDALDYAEVDYIAQDDDNFELDNTLQWLKRNQFPYSGLYMHAVTGEPVSHELWQELRDVRNMRKILREDNPAAVADVADDIFFIENGFASYEDAEKNLVPLVPQELRDLCEWLQLFKNPATVFTLRPVILTMWS